MDGWMHLFDDKAASGGVELILASPRSGVVSKQVGPTGMKEYVIAD